VWPSLASRYAAAENKLVVRAAAGVDDTAIKLVVQLSGSSGAVLA